jgi:peptidoglycan/LPS O-acetylase OafA/YrhL
MALLVPVKHQKFAALTPHLSASLLYVHNIVYQRLSSINPVTWSLEVEIQFYMLVPPLTLLFAIRSTLRRRTLFILLIVICGMAAYLGRHHFLINHSILGSVQNFLAGFLLADVYLLNPCKFRSIGWDVAAVTTLPLMMLTPPFLWKVVLPLGLVLLFWTAFYGRFTNRIFRIEVFSLLGGMCYSYYLLHQQIISIVFSFVHQPVPVQVLVALMLIFIFCTLYYLAVEKPCMDPQWPELLWAKMRRIIAGRSRECGAVIDRDDVSVA